MRPFVDAHHHVWDGDLARHRWLRHAPALQRPFEFAHYREATAATGISGSIVVQVLPDENESIELLHLAAGEALVCGVVGFVDLLAPEVGVRLDAQCAGSGGEFLVGLRQDPGDDSGWFTRQSVLAGLETLFARGLAFDLLIRPAQLKEAALLAQRYPGARLILDHGANPDVASGVLQPWADDVAALAIHRGVYCKLSGLATRAGSRWSADAIAPYVDHLLSVFGFKRIVFGSDWPVCTQVASLGDVLATTIEVLTDQLSSAQVDAILAGNAVEAYGLRPMPHAGSSDLNAV